MTVAPRPKARGSSSSAMTRRCLPGLIDLHTHLLLHPYSETSWDDQVLKESLELRTIRGVAQARATLMAGFTTIRDLGTEGAGFADVALRDAIAKGMIDGPASLRGHARDRRDRLLRPVSGRPAGAAPEGRRGGERRGRMPARRAQPARRRSRLDQDLRRLPPWRGAARDRDVHGGGDRRDGPRGDDGGHPRRRARDDGRGHRALDPGRRPHDRARDGRDRGTAREDEGEGDHPLPDPRRLRGHGHLRRLEAGHAAIRRGASRNRARCSRARWHPASRSRTAATPASSRMARTRARSS